MNVCTIVGLPSLQPQWRRASFLALAALAAVFSLLPRFIAQPKLVHLLANLSWTQFVPPAARYIPDIAWVTTVPFQLLLDSQGPETHMPEENA